MGPQCSANDFHFKGRRDCDFSTNPGPNSCLDGGCNGGLLCDAHTGTGVPPATVAEFTLSNVAGIPDNYDGTTVVWLFLWILMLTHYG